MQKAPGVLFGRENRESRVAQSARAPVLCAGCHGGQVPSRQKNSLFSLSEKKHFFCRGREMTAIELARLVLYV